MRTVDIVAPYDNGRQLEALLVRVHQHLGGRLAGGIWVGGRENAALEQVVIVVLDLPVDLVG